MRKTIILLSITIALFLTTTAYVRNFEYKVMEKIKGLQGQIEALETESKNHITIDEIETALNELSTELDRWKQIAQSRKDQLEGFSRLWEEKYDFEGHQEGYMEVKK
jgi:hypothetical protein